MKAFQFTPFSWKDDQITNSYGIFRTAVLHKDDQITDNSGILRMAVTPVPEFIDPVFTKTSPKRSLSVIQNERFGLVFAKTGSINSDTECITMIKLLTAAAFSGQR
jgi:hypothetical protein